MVSYYYWLKTLMFDHLPVMSTQSQNFASPFNALLTKDIFSTKSCARIWMVMWVLCALTFIIECTFY